MPLRDFIAPRATITHKDEALLTVRGLNLSDLASLVQTHLDDLRYIASLYETAKDEIFSTMLKDNFIVRLVAEVPSIAHTLIALGADEPNAVDVVKSLPLAIQMKALTEIARLTLEDVGGPKGFAALLTTLMGKELPSRGAANTTTTTR